LTAEYSNLATVTGEAGDVLQIARRDTLFHLEIALMQSQGILTMEHGLVAVIMFGFAASWNGKNNTGAQYYHIATCVYGREHTNLPQQSQRFYEEALLYWWAGLAFFNDEDVEALSAPLEF
jgi:hypothetical protein